MSHFTCLVIGPKHEAQLQPFHEFECTGIEDQYVVDVDRTAEIREEYEKASNSMARNDATGELVSAYDDRFYRPFTEEERKDLAPLGTGFGGGRSWKSKDWGDGNGYGARMHEIPSGWTKVDVLSQDSETLEEFIEGNYGYPVLKQGAERTAEHKFGFVEVAEDGQVVRVIKRTNPRAQWDWHQIGGRWTGFFPLRVGAKGKTGKPGVMTEAAVLGTADQCKKGAVDFKQARAVAELTAHREFDVWEECFTAHGNPDPWSSFVERVEAGTLQIEEARTLYGAQPAIAACPRDGFYGCRVTEFGFDRKAYVERQRNGALVPFAIVKDGKWHQRGEMGWWGSVSNEKNEDEWNAEVQRLYDGLPDSTMLTLVDCHI